MMSYPTATLNEMREARIRADRERREGEERVRWHRKWIRDQKIADAMRKMRDAKRTFNAAAFAVAQDELFAAMDLPT